MNNSSETNTIHSCLEQLNISAFSPLDLLSSRTVEEKLIELTWQGVPVGSPSVTADLNALALALEQIDVSQLNVVVLGGGTGLSTIIGGDSRSSRWADAPFLGLKSIFPKTRAIVCATDDGGSTGELLKDLPLIGLGDIRHVMLSSVQKDVLQEKYRLSDTEVEEVAAGLHALFNHRFTHCPGNVDDLLKNGDELNLDIFPEGMARKFLSLLQSLFDDQRLLPTLCRPHCLGNLIITSAIYSFLDKDEDRHVSSEAVRDGLCLVAELIGVMRDAVLPCTTTPSTLRIRYTNGVSITGESKSSRSRRGYPVDRIFVDFSESSPIILPEVKEHINSADIIVFAPGSLYTSIVPILQVPGMSDLIRQNTRALKILVANLWVQLGETDLALEDPARRFYVSDLIKAYHRNIPGGVQGLFKEILLLGMHDIPGSILQNYAVEGKHPIYLDRSKVWEMGFSPVEANIFSKKHLLERKVRHDQATFAKAVKTLWSVKDSAGSLQSRKLCMPSPVPIETIVTDSELPCERLGNILKLLKKLDIPDIDRVADVLWWHRDIPLEHLFLMKGMRYIDTEDWARCQEWDNVFSFYDPADRLIKIRKDMLEDERFEVAFLVALGQSLLGNYAANKSIQPLEIGGEQLGKVYHLTVRSEEERVCFFNEQQLSQYLALARMYQHEKESWHFSRVLNAEEGFTPPGLLFGLVYAWYLDNRFASHIEYKMAIARHEGANLVPEQVKTQSRRSALIDFFRENVFRPYEV